MTFKLRRRSRCGETKALVEFPQNRSSVSGYGYHCKPCHNRISRENREKNHGSTRDFALRRRYGIDAAEVNQIARSQDGLCAICRYRSASHLDHDYSSGANRGVLCFSCNGGLGQFADDVDHLRDLDGAVGALVRRHYRLRRKYRIGLEQFIDVLKAQRGLCAVCRYRAGLQVDHDHETRIVRGVLCASCNTGMGQFQDDPRVIRAAIDYLRLHKSVPDTVHEPAAPYILRDA